MICRISYVRQHLGLFSDKTYNIHRFRVRQRHFFCFLPIIDRTVGLYTSCLGDIASDMEVGRGLCELIGVRLD